MDPARTWMIGNSPKSDINPALEAGLNAVFVPHAHTWALENQDIGPGRDACWCWRNSNNSARSSKYTRGRTGMRARIRPGRRTKIKKGRAEALPFLPFGTCCFYLTLMVTALDACPSTVTITFTTPAPARPSGSFTLT